MEKLNENLTVSNEIKSVINSIDSIDLYLAELPLPAHPKLPQFNRFIQVFDIEAKSNQQFVIFNYEQVLRDKKTGDKINIMLPTPYFVIYPETWSYLRDDQNNAIEVNVKDSDAKGKIKVPTYKYMLWLMKNNKADLISLIESYMVNFIESKIEELNKL